MDTRLQPSIGVLGTSMMTIARFHVCVCVRACVRVCVCVCARMSYSHRSAALQQVRQCDCACVRMYQDQYICVCVCVCAPMSHTHGRIAMCEVRCPQVSELKNRPRVCKGTHGRPATR